MWPPGQYTNNSIHSHMSDITEVLIVYIVSYMYEQLSVLNKHSDKIRRNGYRQSYVSTSASPNSISN